MSDHHMRIDGGSATCDADDFHAYASTDVEAVHVAARHVEGLGYDYQVLRDGVGRVVAVTPTSSPTVHPSPGTGSSPATQQDRFRHEDGGA